MTNFSTVISKWLALFELPLNERTQILDTLHSEVKNGFDVITRISMEEVSEEFKDKELFENIHDNLERIFAYSVWGGYMLNLIFMSKDPEIEKLKEKQETVTLGKEWINTYNKDRAESLINNIDPMVVAILIQGSQVRLNQLFAYYPALQLKPYKEVALIEQFIMWSSYQGYILAELEKRLITTNCGK